MVEDAVDGSLVPPNWGDRLLFGVAAAVRWDSSGVRAYHAAGGEGADVTLGITDRRLLIGEYEHDSRGEQPLGLLWQCPRSDLGRAQVRSRIVSFGRLRVCFVDDSWLEFVNVIAMGRRRAKRLRDAINK